MGRLDLAGRLLWAPQTVTAERPFTQSSRKLRIGFLMGFIGLGIRMIFLIPDNTQIITIEEDEVLQLVVNKLLGPVMALGLFFLLWVLERSIFQLCKMRNSSAMILGSFGMFLILPCIAIPLHALFPTGITAAGYEPLVWVVMVLFIVWHVTWLNYLLKGGHFRWTNTSAPTTKQLTRFAIILAGIEIALTVVAMYFTPMIFRYTMEDFFLLVF